MLGKQKIILGQKANHILGKKQIIYLFFRELIWKLLTQELSKTYPQNFCMSPNLFKLAWMKDPYGYMNLPEYGFPQGPYSPARAISKIGVYFGSKFSNCHIGPGFNLRSISFNV